METIPCIFCGKQSDRIAITENGYTGKECDGCELIFISPRPTAEEVRQLYVNEHAVLYADAQFQFGAYKRMVASASLKKIRKFKERGSLLELGPGGGSFLQEARRWGYEPHGIELNPIEARWINENLKIPCESVALNEGSFGGKTFDVIFHTDVLSHLFDPIRAFSDMNRALKHHGILAFETGNIAEVDKRYLGLFSQFLYPDHLFFFGERSVRTLLERTGFECVHVYKEPIFFELLLQKLLWGFKDGLKDQGVLDEMKARQPTDSAAARLTVKRQLRLLYRYACHYLVALGRILPKTGKPLKLIVIARKIADPE